MCANARDLDICQSLAEVEPIFWRATVIWALVASFIIIALPIWESKDQILAVFDGIFHTNLCEYYNPETSKQHKLHTAAAAAEPAKAADPVS